MKSSPETNNLAFFASCPVGLEPLLESELKVHGAHKCRHARGGVQFEASLFNALKALSSTRLAGRVFLLLKQFTMGSDVEELYQKAFDHDWHRLIPLHQTFKINTLFDQGSKATFNNSMALGLKLKDAIADQIRSKQKDQRPNVDSKEADYPLLMRIEQKNQDREPSFKVQIYLDLCGEALTNRGPRGVGQNQAPLRENLAAAMILLSDWNPQEDLFMDLFCGSGTLLVEAIWIKAQVPASYLKLKNYIQNPNLNKPFAFLKQDWFFQNSELQKEFHEWASAIVEKSHQSLLALETGQFFASDIEAKTCSLARSIFRRAEVEEIITLKRQNAITARPFGDPPGVVMSNLPYGERMGLKEDLESLYENFGENLKKNFTGFRAYILTSESELRKKIRLQTSKRIALKNGNIECRLLRYDLH